MRIHRRGATIPLAVKLPRPALLITLALVLGLAAFYRFGRSIWQPVKLKAAGEKTVAEVVSSLEARMQKEYPELEVLTDGRPLALIAFKEERVVELWKETGSGWTHVRDYPFTGFSGQLGPKLREGDLQIPEGIYRIEYLNPNSSYHLSMKVDYPNAFDLAKAEEEGRAEPGTDIFFHGMAATIGCIPVGNRKIEELFYLVARNGRENTRVIISPYDLRQSRRGPEIDAVTWEAELYDSIRAQLEPFRKP